MCVTKKKNKSAFESSMLTILSPIYFKDLTLDLNLVLRVHGT